MKTRENNRSLSDALRGLGILLLVVSVMLAGGCGESVELKLEQARIAMANDRPDRALSLADAVLSVDPSNRDALLIQASAQVSLGRLGPAKLILDRLGAGQGDDPAVSGALLDWAVRSTDEILESPTFASTPAEVQAYDRARAVADEQIVKLEGRADVASAVGFSRAQLTGSDLRRAEIMIRHTRQMIKDLGADTPVGAGSLGVPDDTQAEPEVVTYGQQLAGLETQRDGLRDELLFELATLLESDPRHRDAATMYLRIIASEQMWERVLEQTRGFAGVTDLPVAIADQAVSVLLAMPDSVMPMDERIELGWTILKQTPAEEAETETRLIASARLFLVSDENEKVMPILSKLIEDGTSDPHAFYMYAQALFATEDYTKCREVMDQMFPAMDSVAPVQLLYGMTLWRLGEVSEARDALRRACQLDPENTVAADAFATVMAQQGIIGATSDDVDAFYKLDPTNPRAIQLKLQHAAASGDTQQVPELLRTIESRGELTSDDLVLLYMGNDILGRHNAAAQWANELVVLQPEEMSAWMRLASTQMKQGDEAGLAETLAQIGKRFPEAPGPDEITGELYLKSNRYEYAVAALNAAVEKDPENPRVRITLARALAAVGRFNSAQAQVQSVLEVTPENIEALALGARIAYARGETEQADGFLKQIDPAQVDAEADPALAAQVYLTRGELEKAAQICTDAITSGNFSPMLRLVLAGIYQERGDDERAEEHLVALIRHFPNSSEAFAWLSQYYARSGQAQRGLVQLEEMEAYNKPLAILARAGLLKSIGRAEESIALLEPLMDELIRERSAMAASVADMISQLYKSTGDEAAAMAVYDRLHAQQAQGAPAVIRDLVASWDTDSPGKRLTNLDMAAARVKADDAPVLIELSRRYAMLGRADQALLIVQRGLSEAPNDTTLLGVKAGVLVMLGRTSEAVDTFKQVSDLMPEDDMVQVRYARALSADGKRPEAEDVLTQLIRAGGPNSLAARAALLETYQGLGLHQRVATMVNAILDKIEAGEDAILDRVIARSLVQQARYAEAQQRLAGVAQGSAFYPSAQVLMAYCQMKSGDSDSALTRVGQAVAEPVSARRFVPALLAMDLGSPENMAILTRADSEIDIETLPYDMALRWLALRLKLADKHQDWALAEATLERVNRLDDTDDSVHALMAVVLYRQGRVDEAVTVLRRSPRLEGVATGALLAFALEVEAPKAGRTHPMLQVLNAVMSKDEDVLASAVQSYSGIRTLFTDDVVAGFEMSGDAGAVAGSCRDLAMAAVAMEGRMPGLGASLCGSAVQKTPTNMSAQALQAAALMETGEAMTEHIERVRRVSPDSSLLLMLEAMVWVADGSHAEAVAPLRKLAERHPENPHIAYQLAQELNEAGEIQEAIAALRPITKGDGPYRLPAMNDLAYLLSEGDGDALVEASEVVRAVGRELPSAPPVLDTAGWVAHKRGNHEQALSLMVRAISDLSDVPEAHYHIGSVYHALGRDRWARYHLEQAASGPAGGRGVREAEALLGRLMQ